MQGKELKVCFRSLARSRWGCFRRTVHVKPTPVLSHKEESCFSLLPPRFHHFSPWQLPVLSMASPHREGWEDKGGIAWRCIFLPWRRPSYPTGSLPGSRLWAGREGARSHLQRQWPQSPGGQRAGMGHRDPLALVPGLAATGDCGEEGRGGWLTPDPWWVQGDIRLGSGNDALPCPGVASLVKYPFGGGCRSSSC